MTRDTTVLMKVPVMQLWAVIISLAAWFIILTEIYWNKGQVPISYLYLIFFLTLIINTISYSVGILIGYWRINLNE